MDSHTKTFRTPEEVVAALPPYARVISSAMVVLGQAVELALNLRDRAVLAEMRQVATEMFDQADEALAAVRNARVQ